MEGLKCVSMVLGAPFVMTSGTTVMPVWCVASWDTLHMVSCFSQIISLIWPELQGIGIYSL